jgi:hypothetical protein
MIAAPGGWPVHLALCVLLLPRAALFGEALFERDLHLDWYPRVRLILATVRLGFLPFWDLSMGFGQPLLGDPSAQVLYPTTWLALLLPPWTLYTVYAVLHLALSAVGMTRLARAAGLRQGAAVATGAAWMLSGPMVSLVNLWHHFAGAAWMPWVILAVHRASRRPGLRSVLGLGACLALQVLAGSGDMVLLTAALCGAWLAAAGLGPSRERIVRAAPALALGLALASLLSAGMWLPAVDLASRSVRRELPLEEMVQRSVPPLGLVRTFVPLDGTGRLAYAPAAQKALFDSSSLPLLASLYVGPLALALAAAALLEPRRRHVAVVLAGVVVVTALLALGPRSPVHGVVTRLVPGAAHFRFPSKVMVALGLASALLAGLGLAAVRSHGAPRRLAGALAVGGALVLAAGSALHGPALRRAMAWGILLDRRGAEGDALLTAVRLLAGAALTALAGTALLRAGREPSAVTPIVAASMVADLLLAHHDLNATAPPVLLVARPPVLSSLDLRDRARSYIYDYRFLEGASQRHLGRAEAYGVAQPPPGVDPRPVSSLAQRVYPVPPVAATWDVEGSYDLDLRGMQPLPQRELTLTLRQAEGTPHHRQLLRMGAVRNVVSLHERGLEDLVRGPTFHGLFPEPIRTWGVPGALPRAYLVGRARAVEGPAAIQALVEPGFEPASEVILSGEGAPAAASAAQGGTGTVRIAELFGDRVRLEADADTPGVLVLVDAWDPGWRAWIDGRPAQVLRANSSFRAVSMPAGRHMVEMRYRPWPILAGLSVSAVGLVALVIGAGCLLLRRLTPVSSTSSAGSRRASACGGGSRSASPPPARPAR